MSQTDRKPISSDPASSLRKNDKATINQEPLKIVEPPASDDETDIIMLKQMKKKSVHKTAGPSVSDLMSEHAQLSVSNSPVNHSKQKKVRYGDVHQWHDVETRVFLKCVSKHRDEFLNTRIRKFKKIADYLNKLDVLSQPITEENLTNKWKALLKKYRRLSNVTDISVRPRFPFMKVMNEILLDSLEPDQYSISIGLGSLGKSIKQKNITKSWYTDDDSLEVTAREVLLKKIEERELKNGLLRKLLDDSDCNIIPNGFNLVNVDQNKLILKRTEEI